tara:strand:- start:9281 stop:10015 length:735 start_codon:yes stop_codon:yes gene_type:complete
MSFMYTAIAVTAATGIYGAYQTNEQGKATAKGIEDQAKVDHNAAAMQMELDSAEEGRVASAERKENRRLRAMQEAAYAGSGVLMEGSAADVLVKQRTVQEANVQNIHVAGGNQRAQDRWKAEGDFKSSMYLAKSTKYAAKSNAIQQAAVAIAGAGVGVAGLSAGAATTGATAATGGSLTAASSSVGQLSAANLASFGGGAFAAPTLLGAGAATSAGTTAASSFGSFATIGSNSLFGTANILKSR